MASRSDLILKAKWAEQAERYDDMAVCMREVVSSFDDALAIDERNLLSVAYKNVVGARRSSWRVVSSIAAKLSEGDKNGEERHLELARSHQTKIEEELKKTCDEVINLLSKNLIPNSEKSENSEGEVFYLKMMGDYYRYIAEVVQGTEKEKAKDKANGAYEKASEKGDDSLPPVHPIRLGLALNYSVFYFEIMEDKNKACSLAKEAFDKAIEDLDKAKPDTYKDSTLIMQLLRDNLTLWNDQDTVQNEQQDD